MMRAKSLSEWKAAMKMRARPTSNFTYADRKGNIFFVWNASLPLLPHPPVDDTVATPVKKTSEMWSKYVPFESLPQVLNPKGGYIHNENNSPHYTNVRGPVDTKNAYPNFEEPELSLRSQLAIQLIGGDEKFSLEDVWKLKHNYRMLTADRVKDDLIAAVKATNPTGDVAAGLALLENGTTLRRPRVGDRRCSKNGGRRIRECEGRSDNTIRKHSDSRKSGASQIHSTRRVDWPISRVRSNHLPPPSEK